MKRYLVILAGLLVLPSASMAAERPFSTNMEDPLWMAARNDILSTTGLSFTHEVAEISEKVLWGVTPNTSVWGAIRYREDLNSDEDGLANVQIGTVVRLAEGSMIYDALADIRFGAKDDVPEYYHTIYTLGIRGGTVRKNVTFTGTLKTSWVFDHDDGFANIDFTPEMQFRFTESWSSNLGVTFRKSTESDFDDIFINLGLNKIYGRTQWVGYMSYAIDESDLTIGGRLHILF